MRRLLLLVAGSVAFWILVAVPARFFLGDASALVTCGVALAICLLPTSLTLLWSNWAFGQSPEHQLTMVLGGTGVRMFVVLGAGLALYSYAEYFRQHSGFWVWLLVTYLFTLGLEVFLMLAGRPVPDQK